MTLARIAGSTVTWLHHDHLGSAVAGTNSAGAVIWRESEQPFGEDWTSAAANDNQAGYTGHVEDAATGLTYMQARYYDPVIGRFLSIDPVGFATGRPSMFNRYAYAANDPINLWDPFGKDMRCAPNSGGMPDDSGERRLYCGGVGLQASGEAKPWDAISDTSGAPPGDASPNSPRTFQRDASEVPESEILGVVKSALSAINPKSIEGNREYGGYGYLTADGHLLVTPPIAGPVCEGQRGCAINLSAARALVPKGATIIFDYHTHGKAAFYEPYQFRSFSAPDISGIESVNSKGYRGGYLANPQGELRYKPREAGEPERVLGSVPTK